MANGVQLATAYISLNVRTDDVKKQVESAFKQAGTAGRTAGNTIGTNMASGIRAKLSDSSFVKNALEKSAKGAGNSSAQGFFTEFRTTSQRAGAVAGLVIGKTIGAGIRGGLAVADFGSNLFSRIQASAVSMAQTVGTKMRSAISGALKGLSLAAVGAVGYTLMAGFERLEKIDQAKGKLKALGNTAKDVDAIMQSATAAVNDTKFSLSDAADLAASAVAAGIKPGKELEKYLTAIADAAAVSGAGLDELGYVMNQVAAGNAAYNDSLQSLQTRGLPIYDWLAKELNTTVQGVKDLASEGKISAEQFQKSIETNIGGAARTMGGTLSSSIDNMRTAVARLGANFLSAILGNDAGDLGNAQNAVNAITDRIKELDTWVKNNKDGIRDFFIDAKDAATEVVNAVRDIGGFLREHPGLVQAAVAAFVGFKTISGVATLATSLAAINTALGVMPGLATAALGPIAALLAAGTGAYFIGTAGDSPMPGVSTPSDPTGERGLQNRQTGTSIMGVPSAVNDPIFASPIQGPNIPGGGGPNASRERRGLAPVNSGLLGGGFIGNEQNTMRGAPGQGFPTQWNPGSSKGGPESWRPAVRQALASYGPSLGITNFKAWEDALVRQIATESGGNPKAYNPNDSNGQGGTQTVSGLLQFLPTTFASHNITGGDYNDPMAQIPAALDYVMKKYGVDANGAPLQIGRGVGYDTGGWLPPGSTMVQNDTGKPELILNPDQQQQLADAGIDPNTLLHGTAKGAAPGPAQPAANQAPLDTTNRTSGFVPVAAGNTGVAGTSFVSGVLNLGNEAVSGAIDAGAQLAQMAASAAIAGGTMGAGAAAGPAAGPAASAGIQIAASVAKRASAYGFQMAGIGADSLIAQLFPFGAPRWLGYDYTQFAPQMTMGDFGITTGEKAANQTGQPTMPGQDAAGPVQPSLMPGVQQPITQHQGTKALPGPAPELMAQPAAAAVPPPPDLMKDLFSYDQGGMLPPGGIGVNMTNQPEPVLTPQQWSTLSELNVAPNGGAPLVKIDAIYGMSPDDVANKIESKQKLAMMRYAGRP